MQSHPVVQSLTLVAAALLLSGASQAQTVIGSGNNVAFPIVINQSGSYKLTRNLTVPPGSHGILVGNGIDVTIDLNGFSLIGGATCSKAGCFGPQTTFGIRVGSSSARIVNGAISGFSANGIGYDGSAPYAKLSVDSVNVNRNFNGIVALYLLATRVTASDNAHRGIQTSDGVVANSLALGNGDAGIVVSVGSVQGNTALYNNQGFILGAVAYDGNVAISNNAGNSKAAYAVSGGNVGL
ncbi:MAG: hypothetical protein V4792_17420 [Pseudomonadota bacterium]